MYIHMYAMIIWECLTVRNQVIYSPADEATQTALAYSIGHSYYYHTWSFAKVILPKALAGHGIKHSHCALWGASQEHQNLALGHVLLQRVAILLMWPKVSFCSVFLQWNIFDTSYPWANLRTPTPTLAYPGPISLKLKSLHLCVRGKPPTMNEMCRLCTFCQIFCWQSHKFF